MLLLSLLASLGAAQVPDQEDPPLTYRLNVGGNWIAGNLSQLQINASGAVNYNTLTHGNDLIVSGYRFWTQLPGTDGLTQLGDDIAVTSVPFYYAREKVPIIGFAHYAHSQLHQIDSRLMGGAAIGYTPVRTRPVLVRSGLGAYYERTAYPSDDFNRDVSHDGSVRGVPRLGLLSTGWYRPPQSAFRTRYLAWVYINPLEPEDLRAHLDADLSVHIAGPLSLQLSLNGTYNSVVVSGVQTYDVRTTAGISLAPPRS